MTHERPDDRFPSDAAHRPFVVGVMKLFSTHPRTEERIQRLQGQVGIR